MLRTHTYIALETCLAHPSISLIQAKSIDHAIEVYCVCEIACAKKLRNGRWRCGAGYFDSARELLSSVVDISFEIARLHRPKRFQCEEVFAGIDWWSLVYSWTDRDFYMRPMRRLGKFYEWYSPNQDYYAIFPSPRFLLRRLKTAFGDAF